MAPRLTRRGRPRRTWPQRLVLATGALLSSAFLTAAFFVGWTVYRLEQVPTYEALALVEPASGEPKNYLLVGSDSRAEVGTDSEGSDAFFDGTEPGGQRSDTVMIARVDPDAETVDMVSFPRDLWIPIAGTEGSERINSAYSISRQTLIDTIEGNFDLPIHHYVEVDFNGFESLVESIDGVPMYFDTAMRDNNSGLFVAGEGCLTLDGDQALSLARSRHLEFFADGLWITDPTGDLGRITRQQVLVLSAISRATALDLDSPARISEVIDVGVKNVTVDPNFTLDDMASLLARFRDLGESAKLRTHSLAVDPYSTYGGASVLALNEIRAEPVLDVFRGVENDGLLVSDINVDVLNGTGLEGQATQVAEALEYVGFNIAEVGETTDLAEATHANSEIHYHPANLDKAMSLGRYLSSGAMLVEDDDVKKGTLVLVTGADFATVTEYPVDKALPPTPVNADDIAPLATSSTLGSGDGDSGSAEESAEGSAEESDDGSDTSGDGASSSEDEALGHTPGEPPDGISCE